MSEIDNLVTEYKKYLLKQKKDCFEQQERYKKLVDDCSKKISALSVILNKLDELENIGKS